MSIVRSFPLVWSRVRALAPVPRHLSSSLLPLRFSCPFYFLTSLELTCLRLRKCRAVTTPSMDLLRRQGEKSRIRKPDKFTRAREQHSVQGNVSSQSMCMTLSLSV